MKNSKKVLYGFRYENLKEKIRYMLSLSLEKRYIQNIAFAQFMNLLKKDRDARKTFRAVQVIKKK